MGPSTENASSVLTFQQLDDGRKFAVFHVNWRRVA